MVAVRNNCGGSAPILKTASYPIDTYESLLGRYFTAQTPNLSVSGCRNAWGALFNPLCSGVNLYFNVATLNYIYGAELTAGMYLNAELPGEFQDCGTVSAANTAICPLPQAKAELRYSSDARGLPRGGEFMFSRTAYPGQFMSIDGGGKFIVPPGGNISIFLSALKRAQQESDVYLAFGFWEEPV